jgi:hypothetical protein
MLLACLEPPLNAVEIPNTVDDQTYGPGGTLTPYSAKELINNTVRYMFHFHCSLST